MPTALIVEDEPEANKLLAMLVQLQGYRTDSAYTGADALAKVAHEPPDLVFLDLMLPDLNGYEVCHALKSKKSTALIPVVMVTARVAVENRIQSFCVGADQYVPKPYTPDQIFRAMAEASAWRTDVNRSGFEGSFDFASRDDGETFRHLAQLRSVMLAHSAIDVESACLANEALREIASDADSFGSQKGLPRIARLGYQLLADRIAITIQDVSGWLSGDPRSPLERWAVPIARGRFQSAYSPEQGSLSLSLVLQGVEPPSQGHF